MTQTNSTSIELKPDLELTKRIAQEQKLPTKYVYKCNPISQGNPGAMVFICQLYHHMNNDKDFELLMACCKVLKFQGEQLYLFFRKHGVEGGYKIFKEKGWC